MPEPRLPPQDPEPDPVNPSYPLPNPDQSDPDVVPQIDPLASPFQI